MKLGSTDELNKLYYSIGEVAEMFDVNTSLIRYWEKEFDIIQPQKNKKGNRYFTPDDIKNLKLIYHLVKEKGMTLRGAQQTLSENKEETVDRFEVLQRLQNIRSTLLDMKNEL